MRAYTVTWTNTATETTEHVHAPDPHEAAHAALARQPDHDTIDAVFTVTDNHTGTERTFTMDRIEKIAWRLWSSSDWEPSITDDEARAIAEAWANEDLFPHLHAWTTNQPVTLDELIADADALHENFAYNETHWPYEVAYEPANRLAAALTRHLEHQRDTL
ncbi:hypothetical protein ACFWPX_30175 [Nocardia sp. NPDC058518]|uniref:hypothetical protein n=1 Tax=Nocardia sp. NPDC058518 TaxID=3346534 RepID=UPI00364CC0DC